MTLVATHTCLWERSKSNFPTKKELHQPVGCDHGDHFVLLNAIRASMPMSFMDTNLSLLSNHLPNLSSTADSFATSFGLEHTLRCTDALRFCRTEEIVGTTVKTRHRRDPEPPATREATKIFSALPIG